MIPNWHFLRGRIVFSAGDICNVGFGSQGSIIRRRQFRTMTIGHIEAFSHYAASFSVKFWQQTSRRRMLADTSYVLACLWTVMAGADIDISIDSVYFLIWGTHIKIKTSSYINETSRHQSKITKREENFKVDLISPENSIIYVDLRKYFGLPSGSLPQLRGLGCWSYCHWDSVSVRIHFFQF